MPVSSRRFDPAVRVGSPAPSAGQGSGLASSPPGEQAVPRDGAPSAAREDLSGMTCEQLLICYRETRRPAAFNELARRHSPRLSAYLARYIGDATLADDVLQDAWLQVHLKCGQYEGGRSVRAWLFAIATHRAIDAVRQVHRHSMVSLNQPAGTGEAMGGSDLIDLFPSQEPGLHDELERKERRHWVRHSVARLSRPLRQALILSDYHGLKYREVAEVLHVPVGTVKSRRSAALAQMRDMAREGHLAGIG